MMRVRVEVAGGVWHARLTDTQGVPTVTLDPVGGVHSRWAVVDGFGRVDRLDRTRRWTADELEALALAVRRLTDHRPVPDVAGM